jgi:hypothetical protein
MELLLTWKDRDQTSYLDLLQSHYLSIHKVSCSVHYAELALTYFLLHLKQQKD